MVLVSDYMRKDISTIVIDGSAFEASKKMLNDKVCYVIVLGEGKPVGIVTMKDLVLKVMAEDKDPKIVKLTACMSSPLVTIDPDRSIEEAIETMKKYGLRGFP